MDLPYPGGIVFPRGRGGTGRRDGFRSRWASALGGSSPLARTGHKDPGKPTLSDEGAAIRVSTQCPYVVGGGCGRAAVELLAAHGLGETRPALDGVFLDEVSGLSGVMAEPQLQVAYPVAS